MVGHGGHAFMRSHNSHVQYILHLYENLLTEDMVQYHESSEFVRDYQTLVNRVQNEGFSFLTKTLSTLAKEIDTSFGTGYLDTNHAFKNKRGCKYPIFLSVLFEKVYEQDGSLKSDLDVSAVKDLRQILYLVYKYEVKHDKHVIQDFLQQFRTTDEELGWEKPVLSETGTMVFNLARTLLGRVFGGISFDIISPKHGPGAVATGERNWEKMNFSRKYEDIHQVYPYYFNFVSNAMDLAGRVKWYKGLEALPSGIAKVVLVPKDSRGPRLISMEPLEYQWVQQGLARLMVETIENNALTKGHVNFRDQTINRNLALSGSKHANSVTLDMKEASDRISLWLVTDLFKGLPIQRKLLGTRTEATELPDGTIHLMRKFAPMGSALCFPVESVIHWALAVASLRILNKVRLSTALESVYVYGDDIIIRGQNHQPLLDTFPEFGLKFNEGKCCTTGRFRESCGMDAIDGVDIVPLKVRKPAPLKPYDATGYLSHLEYCNTLWENGYYHTSTFIRNYLVKLFKVVPHVGPNSDVPGLITSRVPPLTSPAFNKRYNKCLQKLEYQVWTTKCAKVLHTMDRSEYQRKLLNKSDEFVAGVYTVPRRVKLKKGWSSDVLHLGTAAK